MKKKKKPKRTYVVVSPIASQTKLDEEAEKEKKKGEFVRVFRKPQSSGAQPSKKTKSEPSLTSRPKRGKRLRTELDEDLESGKWEVNI